MISLVVMGGGMDWYEDHIGLEYVDCLEQMVRTQIEARGVADPAVLDAMRHVPRQLFVPEGYRAQACEDGPLPIGHGQTISQPFVVAAMTEALQVRKGHRVLEVGTGSGYQAAILAYLGAEVYSIELIPELASLAQAALARAGIKGVKVKVGDGWEGMPEAAPFDRIIVTAAPPQVPSALLAQLKPGGRMVLPVGEGLQTLVLLEKEGETIRRTDLFSVRFVPMVRPGPAPQA